MSDTVVEPLGGWDYADHPLVVWANRLDDRYLVEVVRDEFSDDPVYKARLRIFDKNEDFKVLLDEPTGLSYGAPFGPDVADVASWQERVIEVVDSG